MKCKNCSKEISERVFLFQGICDECLESELDKENDLYKNILKGKKVDSEWLVSVVKAIAKEENNVEEFTEKLLDYIYSHSF